MSEGELLELLINLSDFLDGYVDVIDGDHGEPRPNKAMTLHRDVEDAIAAIEARAAKAS